MRVVEIIQTAFREGELAEEFTWQAVVLIPKGKGDYRGIGLLEVMWKVVAVILNRCLTSSITFHDVVHGFRAGRGTGGRHHRGQAVAAACCHEGGGPLRDLPGPD